MKKSLLFLALSLTTLGLFAQQKNPAKLEKSAMTPPVELRSALDSASYAYGLVLANSLKRQITADWKPELVVEALQAALKGDSVLFTQEMAAKVYGGYNTQLQAKAAEKAKLDAEKGKLEGEKFLADNKKRSGVMTTASGLQYEVLKKGSGTQSPAATDQVKVHYHGTLINGTIFDSSVDRGQPASFPLNRVIKGWTEGLQLMHVGDKFKFFIPSGLAYGDRPQGQTIKPGSTLIFEVELLEINPSK